LKAKLKNRKCKNCKQEFKQLRPLQYLCGHSCALEYAKDKTKQKQADKIKKINKEVRELKEKLKTKKDYEKELQTIVNKFIRLRDKDQPCISCEKPLNTKFDAGHFYPAGSYKNLRFNEDNIHGQCVACNQHRHGNLLEYRPRLIKRIGQDRTDELDRLRNIPAHFMIDELKELKEVYKEKIKKLK